MNQEYSWKQISHYGIRISYKVVSELLFFSLCLKLKWPDQEFMFALWLGYLISWVPSEELLGGFAVKHFL